MVSIDEKHTRGKTRPGRLRKVDEWLRWRLTQRASRPLRVVDLGPGEHAWTTLELVDTLEEWPAEVTAVENDPTRCNNLKREASGRFDVIEAGFDLGGLDQVDFIRAMNVFRQYPVADASAGYAQLCGHLSMEGELLVGSCDRRGDIGTFWVLDHRAARRALVVWTTGARGFAPRQVRDYLPRDIRRDTTGANPFWPIRDQWEDAWQRARQRGPQPLGPIDAFDASIDALIADGRSVELVASGLAHFTFDTPDS